MHADELGPTMQRCGKLKRGKFVRPHRAGTDVANFSTLHDVVERLHNFLRRRLLVEPVDLQNVDVGAQTSDTSIDSIEDVLARKAVLQNMHELMSVSFAVVADLVDKVEVTRIARGNEALVGIFFGNYTIAFRLSQCISCLLLLHRTELTKITSFLRGMLYFLIAFPTTISLAPWLYTSAVSQLHPHIVRGTSLIPTFHITYVFMPASYAAFSNGKLCSSSRTQSAHFGEP